MLDAGWADGQMADGRWQMADGRWQMADGRWQMADGRWQMADGQCGPVLGSQAVGCASSVAADGAGTRSSMIARVPPREVSSSQTLPPLARTIWSTTASPSPVPVRSEA